MRGSIHFEALGKSFTLFLGNAAQCAVEEQFDRGYFAVVADAIPNLSPEDAYAMSVAMSNGAIPPAPVAARAMEAMRGVRQSTLRALAYHGLLKHHPGTTLADVSDIIDDLGDDAFGDVMGRALRSAQGDPSKEEDGEDAAPGKLEKPKPIRKPKRTGRA
ncbi:hypothetical protein ACLN6N_06190 [Sphingomonas carotinifaciens]|uniref:hypothetical protein n=1 Tax=Sphingomonas carotinifaciens TaxID=1166323 RepID=UPI0039A00A05